MALTMLLMMAAPMVSAAPKEREPVFGNVRVKTVPQSFFYDPFCQEPAAAVDIDPTKRVPPVKWPQNLCLSYR